MTEGKKIYIDYNATTPLKPEVKTAIMEAMDTFGNASSMHSSGRLAHKCIEQARSQIAKLINVNGDEIVFTSGGSESNNMVFGTMRRLLEGQGGVPAGSKPQRNEIITTCIEHPCVLNSAKYLAELGYAVTFLPVDEYGIINMDELREKLSEKTLFVSVMMANNEMGTIQNIKEISALVKSFGAWMHSDATQAVGKIPVNAAELGLDYLTMSAHKIYGPKGAGALYARKGAPLFPLIHGGHQENGLRAGTYNTPGIISFGTAAELAFKELDLYGKTIFALKERLRKGLLKAIPGIKINGHIDEVLPNTLNVSFPGAEGEAILLHLDIKGIEASTGSACASGSLEPSHVLLAIGIGPELAHSSIRFSLGWGISEADIDYIIGVLPPIIERLRAMSGSSTRGYKCQTGSTRM